MIDIRTINRLEQDELATFVKEVCDKYGIECVFGAAIYPVEHSFDDPYMQAFFASVEAVRGVRPKGIKSHGGSDARFFRSLNIPVAVFYPRSGGHHGDNEWLGKESLQQLSDITLHFLKANGRTDQPPLK